MKGSIRQMVAAASSTTATGSRSARPREGRPTPAWPASGRSRGSHSRASNRAASPKGTLIAKVARQPTWGGRPDSSAPPITGPMAAPTLITAP